MFICIYVPLYNRSYYAAFVKQIKDYTYQQLKIFFISTLHGVQVQKNTAHYLVCQFFTVLCRG